MQSAQISGFRLSPQQKRVWSLHQGSSSYSHCVQGAFLIAGHLDVEALKDTLQTIVNRHEILRTTFQWLSGMTTPLQVIAEDYEIFINEHSLVDFPLQTQEAEAEALFHQLKQHLFELAETPPFIIKLLKLSPQKHLLFIRLSALIADELTLSQILNEISTLYGADLHAQKYDQEIMQYADVAEWQHELLEQEGYSPGKEYWQNCDTSYSGISPVNFLSTNKALKIPEAHLLSIKLISISLTSDLVERIKALANSLKVSISDILLSCWQVFLWRIAAQEAPTVGIVSSGRTHEELKSTLGALSKYLPLSCSLDHNLSFQEVLKHVSESVNDAYKWQDYFAWEASISDGCQFHFEFKEWPRGVCQKGVSFSLYKRYVHREQFKINLVCLQRDNALEIELYYDASFYQAENIKNLSDWFLNLLENAVHDSKRTIGQLKLLSKHQQQKILVDFNQTQTEYPKNLCIHRVFETQVGQTPDNIAVVFEDQQLTYGELNAKANQLAHYLQKLGVTREQVVGIYLERSHEFITSLLAILKVGGAYLPLDPALPRESLVFRLQDAQVSVVLSQTALVNTLSDCGVQSIDIDSHWEKISQENTTNLSSTVETDNLAYVIFTSGSTGKPKGVAVEHRHLFNYSHAIAEKLNLSVCKSFALVSTFSADLGHTAIFPALLNGACLHIISAQIATNPEALADYFKRYPIDCLKIVPSHLAALLTASRPEQILPGRCLVLGGETCRWELIEQIYTYAPNCHIFNHYGPTETTVGVLTYPINQAALTNKPPHQKTVPIGRPIANTYVYLLNAALQPVPIGVPGEIYIGGAGTARGYLNRPQLTAERFLSNPFAHLIEPALSASTLYKTGDLGRYQPDGTIEFLGRIDNQVKIRGYRIELGEIENAISKHSMVQAAAVLACTSQSSSKRLVAYVVPQKQSNLTVDELRDALKESLLDYMVPAAFVLLKELPLTANGKLDRQALLAYESPSERENSFVAPSTEAEKALVQIWGKTLGVEKIGIHDNFFELGGDSILSIQIVARANQAGLKLTPKQIFENQTIAELASVANTQQAIQAEQRIVLGDVPLTPIQHWFFEQKLPEAHHWNQCVLLKVQPSLELEQLELVIRALLEHHDVLRLRYVRKETGWQQHIAKLDEMPVLTQVDLSAVAEDNQSEAVSETAAELQTSLNLESGPLLRVAYFDLGTNKPGRLLLIIHHLAVDGVSWRILLEDLQIAQQQLSRGDTLQLPSKTSSFQYWATRLSNYGQSEPLHKELDYWLEQSSQSRLPIDFPGGDNTVAKADIVSVALNKAETQALLQEVPAAYKTQINDVLVTAVMQVFTRWTGEYSLLIDLEGHGREDLFEDVDLSRTVGWFTTIFPVKLTLERSDYPGDDIKAIKEQLRRIPNRGIGYGILRYLNTQTTRNWQQAEVRFNYLGQTDQVFQQSPLFAPAYESKGPRHSPKSTRRYPIDIHGIVADGQLTVGWTYSKELYRRTTIELLAKNFIEALRVLITHCQSPWDRT